jgi:hypothetical protein
MSKLSMEALMQRADAVATVDLLNSISGGTENDCHPDPEPEMMTQDFGPLGNIFRDIRNIIVSL